MTRSKVPILGEWCDSQSLERKTGIFSANGTPGVTEHSLGNIRKGNVYVPWKL